LDTQQIQSSDIFLYHKTTHRNIYNDARIRVSIKKNNNKHNLLDFLIISFSFKVGIESNKDLFDVLLYNEKNEITECSIANIAVEYYDEEKDIKFWKTPKIECGLLGGVMRSHLIDNGEIIPGVITLNEIKLAQQV
jgi:para-aminobenzoate synthetase/4-amino-4-deoxychorismate lyase